MGVVARLKWVGAEAASEPEEWGEGEPEMSQSPVAVAQHARPGCPISTHAPYVATLQLLAGWQFSKFVIGRLPVGQGGTAGRPPAADSGSPRTR